MEATPTKLLRNRTMPSCTIIPVLAYEDVDQAITWLCSVFGFTERWRAGSHRAQLAFGDGAIAVSEQRNTEMPAAHSLLVRVPDIALHYEHSKRHGAQILHPPTDYPYGERQYSAVDIGGHVWTFSQSITDVAPEEWGGTTAGPQ